MIGKTNVAGGSVLNFKIIRYATEAELLTAEPADGAIGIVSSYEITARVFSAEQPQSLLDGALWIRTGSSSPAAFNALRKKKNVIILHPLAARQNIGGTMTDVVAKSRIGGEWVDWWTGKLYEAGAFHVTYAEDLRNASIEYSEDGVTLTTDVKAAAYAYIRLGSVDVSRVSAVYATVSGLSTYAANKNLIITDQAEGVTYADATVKAQATTAGESTLSIDLSEAGLSGEQFIYIGTEGLASYTAARQVELTKAYCVLKE